MESNNLRNGVSSVLSVNGKREPETRKFKNAVLSVMKKIKLMARGPCENEILPDPAELPITSSCHLSMFSVTTTDVPTVPKYFQETFQDKIDLNLSLSKTGTCVLYRDKKTKHCVVRDISNATSCCGFFEWYSCYHLIPDSAKIIILDINLNIVHAFHSLIDNHTRAAPIWDNVKHKFVAMFTITDLIKLLHKYYVLDPSVLENIPENTIKDWRDMMDNDSNGDLIYVSPENNLRHAASVIIKHNIHRLPVIDPCSRNVLAIITNSQLFRFFYERFLMKESNANLHAEPGPRYPKISIPSYLKNKIFDLELGKYNEEISSIHPWQTVYDAFDIFVKNQISVLPVVDADNKLIDIYARYDVIASIAETRKFNFINRPIFEALKLRKQVNPPCTCSKDQTLEMVLEIIYQAQVHRIFVVDAEKHILGVISLTDILSFLCNV